MEDTQLQRSSEEVVEGPIKIHYYTLTTKKAKKFIDILTKAIRN